MHVAIIGNGVSGCTAAQTIRSLSPDCRITLISEETDYFYSRTALMYVFMGHMRKEHLKPFPDEFWPAHRIELMRGRVASIEFSRKVIYFDHSIMDATSFPAPDKLGYDILVLATGSVPRRLGLAGEQLDGVGSLYGLQDLARIEAYCKGGHRAVIVGGGLTGIEMAEMCLSRAVPVTMLVRESGYYGNVLPTEEAALVGQHILSHGIDLRLETSLREIVGNERGTIEAVVTNEGDLIACGFLGLTVGVRPNVDWLRDSPLEIGTGILVDACLQTNIPDVYAIGDCAELTQPPPGRKSIEAMWYTGRMMGQTVAMTICRLQTPYQPGIWFNSAKFFDMLYQSYGQVPSAWDTQLSGSVYWQESSGRKSLRIMFETMTHRVTGIAALGMALRQETCTQWIQNGTSIGKVINQLRIANFDPEFSRRHESSIARDLLRQLV